MKGRAQRDTGQFCRTGDPPSPDEHGATRGRGCGEGSPTLKRIKKQRDLGEEVKILQASRGKPGKAACPGLGCEGLPLRRTGKPGHRRLESQPRKGPHAPRRQPSARGRQVSKPFAPRLRRRCSAEREFQGESGRREIGDRGPAAGTSSRGREEGAAAGPRGHGGSASGGGSGFHAGKSQQRNSRQCSRLLHGSGQLLKLLPSCAHSSWKKKEGQRLILVLELAVSEAPMGCLEASKEEAVASRGGRSRPVLEALQEEPDHIRWAPDGSA
ncbi:uncharacterized protein LOC121499846 [Vulpes lagopus]|uniref:uncharacterized protein LOC121499846 n=1 Tax=Vulpes lagopus TaxID=494514 RepID=UPI001BCA2DD3|nr:uncharacterized protein LOC121499846 [Vulpes lagopus]